MAPDTQCWQDKWNIILPAFTKLLLFSLFIFCLFLSLSPSFPPFSLIYVPVEPCYHWLPLSQLSDFLSLTFSLCPAMLIIEHWTFSPSLFYHLLLVKYTLALKDKSLLLLLHGFKVTSNILLFLLDWRCFPISVPAFVLSPLFKLSMAISRFPSEQW